MGRATPTSESSRPALAGASGLRTTRVRASPARASSSAWVRGVKCQMCSVGLSVHHRVPRSRAGSEET
jgi:hypothetical protein